MSARREVSRMREMWLRLNWQTYEPMEAWGDFAIQGLAALAIVLLENNKTAHIDAYALTTPPKMCSRCRSNIRGCPGRSPDFTADRSHRHLVLASKLRTLVLLDGGVSVSPRGASGPHVLMITIP